MTPEQVAFQAIRMHELTPVWLQAITCLRGRVKAYYLGHCSLSMAGG